MPGNANKRVPSDIPKALRAALYMVAIALILLWRPLSLNAGTSIVIADVNADSICSAQLTVSTTTITFPSANPSTVPMVPANENPVTVNASIQIEDGKTATLTTTFEMGMVSPPLVNNAATKSILSYLYFRGLSLGVNNPYFQIQVLGGGMTISKGLLGETFEETGEDVYGVVARTQPWERLNLEGDFFQTQNEKDYTGNLITRSNDVYRMAGELQTWSKLYALGEFMQSFSEDPDRNKQDDIAYRAGAIWRGDRLHLEGNYYYECPDFHLIAPYTRQNRMLKACSAQAILIPGLFLESRAVSIQTKTTWSLNPQKV
jgi:hypothetical protein